MGWEPTAVVAKGWVWVCVCACARVRVCARVGMSLMWLATDSVCIVQMCLSRGLAPECVCLTVPWLAQVMEVGLGNLCVDFERRSLQLCPVYSWLVSGFLWLLAFLILGLEHPSDLDL